MGLFDFIKDAGASVFAGKDDIEEPTKPLSQHLQDHGISPEGIEFAFTGEGITVTGTVRDQEMREKIITIIGNVKGVERVDDRLQTAEPPAGASVEVAEDDSAGGTAEQSAAPGWTSRTYTVQSGDTLSKIAREMYGDASRYTRIFDANRPMLKDPNKIYPGQVLRIPKLD